MWKPCVVPRAVNRVWNTTRAPCGLREEERQLPTQAKGQPESTTAKRRNNRDVRKRDLTVEAVWPLSLGRARQSEAKLLGTEIRKPEVKAGRSVSWGGRATMG